MAPNYPRLAEPINRNREIDLLRFIAAFTILLYHYTYAIPRVAPSFPYTFSIGRFFRYGYLSVDLFFIISGYVIMLSAYGKTPRQFIRSRVFRLYPAYWISCVMMFAFLAVASASNPRVPHVSVVQFLFNLTMFQEFFGYASINNVYWTLTYELSFYIIIVIIIAFKGWDHILYILSIWLAYTFIAGPRATNNYLSLVLIPKYSANFIAGILFYLLRKRMYSPWKLYGLLVVSFALSLRSAKQVRYDLEVLFTDHFSFALIAGIIGCFFLVFWWISVYQPDFSRQTFFSKLGALTYPLYLIQIPGTALFYLAGNRANNYIMLLVVTGIMLLLAWVLEKGVNGITRGIKGHQFVISRVITDK